MSVQDASNLNVGSEENPHLLISGFAKTANRLPGNHSTSSKCSGRRSFRLQPLAQDDSDRPRAGTILQGISLAGHGRCGPAEQGRQFREKCVGQYAPLGGVTQSQSEPER